MLRKLTISAALLGIFGLAALLSPASSTSGALSVASPDAIHIPAPVISMAALHNNNG